MRLIAELPRGNGGDSWLVETVTEPRRSDRSMDEATFGLVNIFDNGTYSHGSHSSHVTMKAIGINCFMHVEVRAVRIGTYGISRARILGLER